MFVPKVQARIKDNQPVYIKSYRIPHSQKEEVNKQDKKLINDDVAEPQPLNIGVQYS